ncbi:unnamed protein product [Colias eurytheme]|nr:unnamed protein product [Colias eurytheme]
MTDTVNMSLDEIIKQNKQNQANRGGGTVRGRGGGRGGRRGRGGRGGGARRGRSQSRPGTPNSQQRSRSRSRSRGPRGQAQTRGRSQSRNRSRSQQRRRSFSRGRSVSRSRSQVRGLTPKGRAGLENHQSEMPPLLRRNNRINRGGFQMRLRRSNSMTHLQGGVHSRLGVAGKKNNANASFKPLAVAKRGIAKRGRGFTTRNKYSNVGLRSDFILQEQRQNVIRSQTFTRSRNNSLGSASQLTVSVANDFAKRRRNSFGNANYLNKQSLAQLNNEYGGYRKRGGPGSVKSIGSNKSNRSNSSKRSTQSRGRGRGRGNNRGVGRKFINKQILNPRLQQEIAAVQGKVYGSNDAESPAGFNFTPTPATTKQTMHQRFATA